MSHPFAANLMLPNLLQTMHPSVAAGGMSLGRSAGAQASAAGASTTTAPGGLGSTFLNLLVKELQNQDPTAPMDSTAMVGQMISLNQLDQLIAINQKTTTSSAGVTAKAIGTTAAKAVSGPSQQAASTTGANAAFGTGPARSSSEHLQLSKLLHLLHGGSPASPITGGPAIFDGFKDMAPISIDESAFGLNGLNDIPGGK